MNNRDIYKDAMSGVRHSDDAIERIFDMTVDKKVRRGLTFKKLASVALAFALLIAGVGVNHFINNKETAKNPQVVQSNTNPLSVMVAYAGEYKQVSDIKADSMNEQNVFYSIHYADITDEKAIAQAEKLYELDRSNLEKDMDALSSEGHSAVLQSGKSTINSPKGEATVKVYVLLGGIIALNTDNYSDFKKMTISNISKYGELVFNYVTKAKSNGMQQIGNKISISGNELRESQESSVFECGTSPAVNKGYELFWNITDDVYQAIGNDPKFDLSQIKDTITFTVEYNDGTVQTASLNLYFDSDGYMHFE
ncbi:MAG: hypothetical protein ACI4XC_02855 [Eubacterium sp.]